MNKGFRRLFMAAVFLTGFAVLFSSCKRPEQNIGLALQPEEDLLNVILIDTTSIKVSTLRVDSLRSDELSRQLAGFYTDPIFGDVAASFNTQIRLASNNVDFGNVEDLEVDSIILALRYGSEVYGGAFPQSFGVYELAEDLFIDSNYYTNQSIEYYSENWVVDPGTTLDVDLLDYVAVGEDSILPHLRIPIKPEFADKLFSVSGGDELSDNESFLEYFKGLHVRSTSNHGGCVQFDLRDAISKMTIYYRDVVEEDTLTYDLILNDLCARFTQFEHRYNYEASIFNDSDSVAVSTDVPYTYVQAAAGLETKVDFEFLKEYQSFEGLALGKAELILPVRDSDSPLTPKQDQLFIRTYNENGDLDLLPDQNTFNFNIGGSYEPSNRVYRFVITRFIQEMINGERSDYGVTIVSNNGSITNRRVVFNGPSLTGDDSSENMRLLLTFSY